MDGCMAMARRSSAKNSSRTLPGITGSRDLISERLEAWKTLGVDFCSGCLGDYLALVYLDKNRYLIRCTQCGMEQRD